MLVHCDMRVRGVETSSVLRLSLAVEISLPSTAYAVAVYYILAPAEASSNLSRYDGVRYGKRIDNGDGVIPMYRDSRAEGFGPEVKRRIILGTYVLSSGYSGKYYLKAQKARTLIQGEYKEAFKNVDVIMGPVSPTPARKIGEHSESPLEDYLADRGGRQDEHVDE